MLLAHIPHNGLVKVVPGKLDGGVHHRSPQGDHRDVRGAAADVHDHIAAGPGNINACADGRRHRFLDQVHLPGSRRVGSLFYRLPLNLCDAAWHADADPWLLKRPLAHGLLDKIFDHLLCHGIIGDHALSQRPDRHNIPGRPAQHKAGLLPDGLDGVGIPVKRHNRRFL